MSDESQCDALIRQLGGTVVAFGRKGKRTRNAEGVPDRLYFLQGVMVWFEVKSANDYLSAAQVLFLTQVHTHAGIAGCGNRADLLTLLNAPNRRKAGFGQIAKYATRQKALRATP